MPVTLLVSALLLLASARAAPPPPFIWPTPHLLVTVPSHQTVRVNGVPVHLELVLLKENAHALLQVYADAFYRAGFFVPPDKDQIQLSKYPMLTALDPRTNITYTVILRPHPNGTTTVYFGEANFALRDPTRATDFAPVFPNAGAIIRSTQEGTRVMAFTVKASQADIESFYQQALKRVGYTEDPKEPLEFHRGFETIRIADAPKNGSLSVVLFYESRRPAAAPAPSSGP